MKTDIDHYAVMGNPIAQSLSPTIHNLFATQTQQALVYEAILVAQNDFERALKTFQARNGKGLNITLPFKESAFAVMDMITERAKLARAVNTIVFHANGKLEGDNTDGIGLVRDLTQNLGISLQGQQILLLGAGGAARGVVPLLLEQQPSRLVIANRTMSKAQQLVADFNALKPRQPHGPILQACAYTELQQQVFDVIIHATAAGTLGQSLELPAGLLPTNSYCYDLAYEKNGKLTSFLQAVRDRGCTRYNDGLGMLVEQAAESFYLWRGVRPETKSVIAAIKMYISKHLPDQCAI